MKRFLALLLAILLLFAVGCTPGTLPPAGGEGGGEEEPPTEEEPPNEEEPPVQTESLTLSCAPYSYVGGRISVSAAWEGHDLSSVEFSLSDTSFCSSFTPSGASCSLRFKKAGELTVTARCGEEEASCTVYVFPETSTHAATDALITYLGRTAEQDGVRVLRNTACGFEITFYGKKLTADWEVVSGESAIAVLLDGEEDPEADKRIVKADGKLVLAEFDTAGTHTVRVQKVSEESISVLALRSLTVEKGGLLETEPIDRVKIEVYGDSITCGYGNMRPQPEGDALLADTQNGLNTYAAIAARRLDADYRVFARSGIGLYTNPHGLTYHMPDVMDRISPMSPASDKWDMQANAPDVVIINLGTNDCGAANFSFADFRAHVVSFVKNLQEAYGKTDIIFVLCTGMMVKNVTASTAEAATVLQSEGINAHALDLPIRSHASGHPLYSQHLAAADVLYEKLAELLTQ